MEHVRVSLTTLQAECLLQLAQEVDFDTFCGDGRRWRAGEAALDKLCSALAAAEQFAKKRNGPAKGRFDDGLRLPDRNGVSSRRERWTAPSPSER